MFVAVSSVQVGPPATVTPGRLLASLSGANLTGTKPLHHDTVAGPGGVLLLLSVSVSVSGSLSLLLLLLSVSVSVSLCLRVVLLLLLCVCVVCVFGVCGVCAVCVSKHLTSLTP